jgi:hypothetical protein
MKQKVGTLKKMNIIDRPLANLTKRRTEKNPNQYSHKYKKGDNNKNHRNPGNYQRLL